jgi:hypothetical protein
MYSMYYRIDFLKNSCFDFSSSHWFGLFVTVSRHRLRIAVSFVMGYAQKKVGIDCIKGVKRGCSGIFGNATSFGNKTTQIHLCRLYSDGTALQQPHADVTGY